MSYNVNNYCNVYNSIYSDIERYNFHNLIKDIYVDVFAAYVNGSILDAGCGEGIHLKRLLKDGYDAFGIELSSVCCEKYLLQTPHDNIDIIGFAKKNREFDGLICMDVLEHVPYEGIEETIEALSKISQKAFLGIANHSDILNGVELHIIQQDKDWWLTKLKKFYKNVSYISDQFDNRFFYIYCNNTDEEDLFYKRLNIILKKYMFIDEQRMNLILESEKLNVILNEKNSDISRLQNEIENIKNTRGYKLIVIFRTLRDKVKGIFK